METIELELGANNAFTRSYMNGEAAASYFDYSYIDETGFQSRAKELANRRFPRQSLSEHLRRFNQKYTTYETVFANIEKLKQTDSTVVIGGQQAGVLTGPLYTLHKCISVIQLAKQEEQALGKPVLPVFWIAGEDHDFAEINHTYILKNNQPQKSRVPEDVDVRQPVSDIVIDQKTVRAWLKEITGTLGETQHTKEMFDFISSALASSETYVDWFAHLLMGLFEDEGLILVDSGNAELRQMESSYFKEIIDHNDTLNRAVFKKLRQLQAASFDVPLSVEENSAHVFYHTGGERVLLERDDEGNFRGKNNECLLSASELLDIAGSHPELLSNNVVTRPLMQEWLFPTLAFVGGPGEIAYWGALGEMFHSFSCSLPPVVPRLNITLVDRRTERWLNEHDTSVEQALNGGIEEQKEHWLSEQKQWPIDAEAEQVKSEMVKAHRRLHEMATDIDSNLHELGDKNIGYILAQIDYFAEHMEASDRKPYEKTLAHFDRIEACLCPQSGPQERIWSILPLINQYGFDWLKQMLARSFSFNGKHKVVFL